MHHEMVLVSCVHIPHNPAQAYMARLLAASQDTTTHYISYTQVDHKTLIPPSTKWYKGLSMFSMSGACCYGLAKHRYWCVGEHFLMQRHPQSRGIKGHVAVTVHPSLPEVPCWPMGSTLHQPVLAVAAAVAAAARTAAAAAGTALHTPAAARLLSRTHQH